jgi:hypothetical protein
MRGQDARELPPQPLARSGDEDDFFTNVEYVRHEENPKDVRAH